MTSPELPNQLRLLAVVGHPHDITHMLGTCGNHVEHGDAVTVVAVTGGRRMHNELLFDELLKPPEERDREIMEETVEAYGERKVQEFREVCRLFGITDARILPFLDSPLELTDEVVQTLAEILYEVRPHIVLTHPPMGNVARGRVEIQQDDHNLTGMAVNKALAFAGTPQYGSERRPHRIAALYHTAVGENFHDFDLCIDITDQAAKRMKAEMSFRTQGASPEMGRKHVEIRSGTYGWNVGVAYAEGFYRAGVEVQKYLPVTDHALRGAEEPSKEHMARIGHQVAEID